MFLSKKKWLVLPALFSAGELLEILGSIINGFAIPLKKEHLLFLQKALIPLHKPKCVNLYHQQLSYCIVQYVEKDPDTVMPVLIVSPLFWERRGGWGDSTIGRLLCGGKYESVNILFVLLCLV